MDKLVCESLEEFKKSQENLNEGWKTSLIKGLLAINLLAGPMAVSGAKISDDTREKIELANDQDLRTTKVISEKKIGTLNCHFDLISQKGTERKFLYIGYQNAEYSHIVDIGSVAFSDMDQGGLSSFIDDLKEILPIVGTKAEASIKKTGYDLKTYDFSKTLYLSDEDGKYTQLSSKQVEQLILWLESIDFN